MIASVCSSAETSVCNRSLQTFGFKPCYIKKPRIKDADTLFMFLISLLSQVKAWFLMVGGFSNWESWYLHLQHRNLQRETDSRITWFTSDWFLRFWCKQLKWSTFLWVVDEVRVSGEAQACCLLLEVFQLRLLQGWLFACKQKHSNGWTFWILNENFNFCG